MDSGHSFLKTLDVTRYNLVLSAFFWAWDILNGVSSLGDAFPMVYKFASKALEMKTISPTASNSFQSGKMVILT
jgi:hypothetical protein